MKTTWEFVKMWLRLNFRDPARIIIGLLLPIVVLVIFGKVRPFPDMEAKTGFTLKLVAFFIIFGSVDLMTLVELREKGVLRKLHTTPLSAVTFLTSHVLARLFLSLLSMILVLAVAVIWWRIPFVGFLLPLITVVTLGSLAFIALGDLIVSLTPSTETAFALGPVIVLPLLIFGEVFFKFQRGVFWFISQIMPSTYLVRALEKMGNGVTLTGMTVELAVLTAWVLITSLLATRLFRWD